MNIEAGRLRHRITLQAPRDLLDSNGDVIQNQETGEVARVWDAQVDPVMPFGSIDHLAARELGADAAQSVALPIRQTEVLPRLTAQSHQQNGTVVSGIFAQRQVVRVPAHGVGGRHVQQVLRVVMIDAHAQPVLANAEIAQVEVQHPATVVQVCIARGVVRVGPDAEDHQHLCSACIGRCPAYRIATLFHGNGQRAQHPRERR